MSNAWNPAPLQALLFDHDGTLVDSETGHWQQWNQALAELGVSIDEADYSAHYAGLPTVNNAQRLLDTLLCESESRKPPEQRLTVQDLVARKQAATRAYLQGGAFPLMPGVREMLQFCQQAGLRMAIVTGARQFVVEATLRFHGLEGVFETVVSADDVQHSKPHPACYLLALQRMGLQASQALAVEDTQFGLAAAHGAGVACVAIPTPLSAHHDFAKAVRVMESLGQLQRELAQKS
ncbi:HAD family phosphatase [Curvibacter sp. CHRR-16]|uniref:HAD family hydrolase n=1 Tax=Curvibacter sp. CHRR-16 TaxID=2835872 RepID=UPI001BDA1F28|nr:HAD family phosphatase [Curvibacter sp. CHRR-16]MBT0569677.1 HAD family phosphatase [Curvibacter sp. CHRR-16]